MLVVHCTLALLNTYPGICPINHLFISTIIFYCRLWTRPWWCSPVTTGRASRDTSVAAARGCSGMVATKFCGNFHNILRETLGTLCTKQSLCASVGTGVGKGNFRDKQCLNSVLNLITAKFFWHLYWVLMAAVMIFRCLDAVKEQLSRAECESRELFLWGALSSPPQQRQSSLTWIFCR